MSKLPIFFQATYPVSKIFHEFCNRFAQTRYCEFEFYYSNRTKLCPLIETGVISTTHLILLRYERELIDLRIN